MKRKLLLTLLALFIGFSCTKKNDEIPTELNLFVWSEYIPQEIIDEFAEKNKIKVSVTTYGSNEEMMSKLMAGASDYDIILPSTYFVTPLARQNLVQEINLENIPNFKNLGKQFVGLPFDPKNKYSVPYMTGGALLAVNKKKLKKEISSYADLWDPSLKNQIVVLDDSRNTIGMALRKLGHSWNETDPKKLEEAKVELIKLLPNIKAFDSDSPKDMLINGEATVGYVWGAEAVLAKEKNPDIEVVFPKEGMNWFLDSFMIASKAKNVKAAEMFINYILDPQVSAKITEGFPYTNPNEAAKKYMPESILKNPAIFPPEIEMKKAVHFEDLGAALQIYDRIWSEAKR